MLFRSGLSGRQRVGSVQSETSRVRNRARSRTRIGRRTHLALALAGARWFRDLAERDRRAHARLVVAAAGGCVRTRPTGFRCLRSDQSDRRPLSSWCSGIAVRPHPSTGVASHPFARRRSPPTPPTLTAAASRTWEPQVGSWMPRLAGAAVGGGMQVAKGLGREPSGAVDLGRTLGAWCAAVLADGATKIGRAHV